MLEPACSSVQATLSFFLIRTRVLLTVFCKSLTFLIEISSGLSLLNEKTPAKAGVFSLSVSGGFRVAAIRALQSGELVTDERFISWREDASTAVSHAAELLLASKS